MKEENTKQDEFRKVKIEGIDYSGKIQLINNRKELIKEKNG